MTTELGFFIFFLQDVRPLKNKDGLKIGIIGCGLT
jgi:hypothetical protein